MSSARVKEEGGIELREPKKEKKSSRSSASDGTGSSSTGQTVRSKHSRKSASAPESESWRQKFMKCALPPWLMCLCTCLGGYAVWTVTGGHKTLLSKFALSQVMTAGGATGITYLSIFYTTDKYDTCIPSSDRVLYADYKAWWTRHKQSRAEPRTQNNAFPVPGPPIPLGPPTPLWPPSHLRQKRMIKTYKKEVRRNYQTTTEPETSKLHAAMEKTQTLSPSSTTLDESNGSVRVTAGGEELKVTTGGSLQDASIDANTEILPTPETPISWPSAWDLWTELKSATLWILITSQASMIAFAIGRRARSKLNRKHKNLNTRPLQQGPAPNQDGYYAVDLGPVDLREIGLGGYEAEDGYEIAMPLPQAPPPPPPPPGPRPAIMPNTRR